MNGMCCHWLGDVCEQCPWNRSHWAAMLECLSCSQLIVLLPGNLKCTLHICFSILHPRQWDKALFLSWTFKHILPCFHTFNCRFWQVTITFFGADHWFHAINVLLVLLMKYCIHRSAEAEWLSWPYIGSTFYMRLSWILCILNNRTSTWFSSMECNSK